MIKQEEILSENDLVNLGFIKHTMIGTGWNSISSMRDAIYYYENGRITISAEKYWRWYVDNEPRNDIAVSTKEKLEELLIKYNQSRVINK